MRSERDRAVGSSRTLKQTVTALEAEKTQLLTQVCSQLHIHVPVSQSEARYLCGRGFPGTGAGASRRRREREERVSEVSGDIGI